MSKICIFGGNGRIGKALTHFLSALGHEVDTVDNQGQNLYGTQLAVMPHEVAAIRKYDIYVSCAPTHMNEAIRAAANAAGAKYTDFGGDNDHQDVVREDFLNCDHGVLTGIGLAPGYVNLVASDGIKFIKSKEWVPKTIYMYVGGLPQQKSENLLGWLPTWSIDGLLQSYEGSARILENGNIKDVESTVFGHVDMMTTVAGQPHMVEAFCNSGGISHTLYEAIDEGIENCFYYTVRWPGHVKMVKALREMAEEFKISKDDFKAFLLKLASTGGKDFVTGKVIITYKQDDDEDELYSLVCNLNFMPSTEYTAMQIATAVPGAAMIDHMLKTDLKGYLTYRDLDAKEIFNTITVISNKCGLGMYDGESKEDVLGDSDAI